ncbi:chemotaxis protein CheW [Sphingomonas sp. TDK1]|uniref:chemotaxis protein CheW n=1 Tax=Sphingomonas sp. TDK1 TaxID=453247 RepID=UPI0007D966DA|nr:chemotaxis protein CheW [Sphingomonas sp. TDK1]OAN63173.1 chemotaxis protein CheW [Sphingomonas sp. TDK1]
MTDKAELQIVTFGLGAEVFAVPVSFVREILDYRETFRIPNGPEYLLGLTDMRGEGVTTIDLRLRLGLPPVVPTSTTRILVVDVPVGNRVLMLGLVVDRVLEVCSIAADLLEGAPDIGVRWPSDYIGGVFRRADSFVVLVEIGKIFSAEDAAELESQADAA